MTSALDAAHRRRSRSSVTPAAPSRAELLPLVAAAATVADHGSLRPCRLIELRGDARHRLGAALAAAAGADGPAAEKLAGKPLRAELLIAVVAISRPSVKVHDWEQEAVASGVAHMLSLLLDEAGWGVMWRSGPMTRSADVHRMHELAENERLLGWLYVGGVDEAARKDRVRPIDPEQFLTAI
ncbi:nitroreductase family protein [Marisediminicola senii]|uniref:nitroreductase family protein n=1 Tax=Marisediminicola senii TaxID=2711233 RepID=UPI0013E9F95F|nr:nitroreductase family protein [Marisediminicola senii]